MNLKETTIEILRTGDKLTVHMIAELAIVNKDLEPKMELPVIKKKLSMATTKWKGFVREKIDGTIHVSYNELDKPEVLTKVNTQKKDKKTVEVPKNDNTVTFLRDGETHTSEVIKKQGALTLVTYCGVEKWIKTNTIIEG